MQVRALLHSLTSAQGKHRMKIISLDEAYDIIQGATAVIVNNDTLVYPILHDLETKDNNVFMSLECDGKILKFTEGDNRKVIVSGCNMSLLDTSVETSLETTELTILTTKYIE